MISVSHVVHPDNAFFAEYERVPMLVHVHSVLKLKKIDRGFGGIALCEIPVEPYVKDLGQYELPTEFGAQFDIRNWAFFAAYDDEKMIGAATVACKTKEIIMLSGRDDLCVLWDIRVDDAYKGMGVGSKLLNAALEWARVWGFRQMKIECQNNNLPAARFYHKQGAVLCALDEYFYYNEPDCRDEVALFWYIDI